MAKKSKTADFQKVKLKLGRRLPKGINVTDTSFKAKKIILHKQLKPRTSEPTTSKKLSIEDLFIRLQHYRLSTRLSTLVELKQLITQYPNLISLHLSSLIELVTKLIIDEDEAVRKATIKLLEAIFKNVSSSQLSPFFHVLSAYLCCAMTHIFSPIRNDSLHLLDLLLDSYPELVTASSSNILKNFVKQISNIKQSKSEKSSKLKNSRVLSIMPDEKVTSQKWRIHVLMRLEKFLKAAINNFVSHQVKDNADIPEVSWDRSKPLHIMLYRHGGLQPKLSTYSLYNVQHMSDSATILRNQKLLKNFISILMPLLIDTWIESAPSAIISTLPGNLLPAESAETMNCVLHIMLLLGQCIGYVEKENNTQVLSWFQENFSLTFFAQFMTWFPYFRHRCPLRKRKIQQEYEISLLSLNLAICEVFTFMVSPTNSSAKNYYNKVFDYLEHVITTGEVQGVVATQKIVTIFHRIAKNNQHSDKLEVLLISLLDLFQHWEPGCKDRDVLFAFFTDLTLQLHCNSLVDPSLLDAWLMALPSEVVTVAKNDEQSLPSLLLHIKKICRTSYPSFLNGLQENALDIINLLNIPYSDDVKQKKVHRGIVEMIYRIPHLSLECFRCLAENLKCFSVPLNDVTYMTQVLTMRLLRSKDAGIQPEFFMSFLFALSVGVFGNDGENLFEAYSENELFEPLRTCFFSGLSPFTIVPSEPEAWNHHFHVAEAAFGALLQFPDLQNVDICFQSYLLKRFTNSCSIPYAQESATCLPVHSAATILILKAKLTPHDFIDDPETDCWHWLTELAVALLFHEVAAPQILAGTGWKKCYSVLNPVLQFIESTRKGIMLCEILGHWSSEISSVEQAKHIGVMVLLLMKSGVLKGEDIIAVASVMEDMEDQIGEELEKEQWWSEINYELSLRQRELHSSE